MNAQTAPIEMPGAQPSLQLSIVIPTYNERDNLPVLVRKLHECLRGIEWEMVVVDDDSPDATANVVRELARHDRRVRCVHRIGRRGLSTACIEGILASSAPVIAVMDADLQHDETRLPVMLGEIHDGGADLVVASRYVQGGSLGEWDASRAAMSRFATRLSRLICKQDLSDPMSGFFMVRREAFETSVRSLSGLGFKILLDLIASSPKKWVIREVPYTFGVRVAGESKLDSMVLWEFGMLLADKMFGRYVPVRFVAFGLVGGAGVIVHMAVVATLLQGMGIAFAFSQGIASAVAMVFNYSINNILTYRDRRLRGWRWFGGLLSFVAACSIGAFANVGIASYLFERDTKWMLAALAGILVGAVWNYAVTTLYTWGKPKAK